MNPTAEARRFFDDFVEAFHRFDGALIARRYQAPYLSVSADGTARNFPAHADIGPFFQQVVDDYHRQGCRACRYRELDVLVLGGLCLQGTVTWELLSEDRRIVGAWRESYWLNRGDDGLKIVASVDHAL